LAQMVKDFDQIQIKIVFPFIEDKSDSGWPVAMRLMCIDAKGNSALTARAFTDWYTRNSQEDWENEYPVDFNESAAIKLRQQYMWCRTTTIDFSPAILVNGYKLPNIYKVEDLEHLL